MYHPPFQLSRSAHLCRQYELFLPKIGNVSIKSCLVVNSITTTTITSHLHCCLQSSAGPHLHLAQTCWREDTPQVINQTPYQCRWGRFCVSFPASQYQLPNPHQSRPRLWNETKQNVSPHQGAQQNTPCFSVIGRRDLGGIACRGCNKAPRCAPDRLESRNKEWRRCGGHTALIPAKNMNDKHPKWQTPISSLSSSLVFCATLGRGGHLAVFELSLGSEHRGTPPPTPSSPRAVNTARRC